MKAIGAPHVGESSEKEIIKRFVDRIDELRPQLVTYNGSSFDLPVLCFRAMSHELEAPGLLARPYFNRYSNDALDLCDALSSFGATTKLKLDEICKFMGFDGKPENIDGSKVDEYFCAGRINEIAEYCKTDVVNTYRLFLRYSLFCGQLDQEGFRLFEERLVAFIRRQDHPNREI